jgi:hypothetical protein
MLKSQDTVIAVLRPRGYKSTFMMESNPQTNSIKIFEFERSALEKMNDVLNWAEEVIEKRIAHYKIEYKWRTELC